MNKRLSYAIAAILFLIGVVTLMVCLGDFLKLGDPHAWQYALATSISASLIATALYVFLTASAHKDPVSEMYEALRAETDALNAAIDAGTAKLDSAVRDACDVINREDVSVVVNSDAGHLVDFETKFRAANRIDIACHTGGTVISNNITGLTSAFNNGATIRILFNNTNYEFFDPNNVKYANLQESLCPDKSSFVYTDESIKTLGRMVKNNLEAKGKIDLYYSDGLITGQIVIIDDSEAYFTPYLPGTELNQSFRIEFKESSSDHIDKLKLSFNTTWNKMLAKRDGTNRPNRIVLT